MTLAVVAFASASTAVAAEPTRPSDGAPASVTACRTCHGLDGAGREPTGIPRLAGLDVTYMKAQLAAFADGTRDNAAMARLAREMDPVTLGKALLYYARLPLPPVTEPVPPGHAAGEQLATRGDWSRDVPPCASCHGIRGLGVGAAFPPVAGQPAAYIRNQLQAWKDGTRRDDPQGLMRSAVGRLDPEQIAAVAAYYASLSGAHPPPQPPAGGTPHE